MSELVERLRIKADLFASSFYPRSFASMREDARDLREAADLIERLQAASRDEKTAEAMSAIYVDEDV